MSIRHRITIAYRGLRANKTRSGLTVLGIVIGITSIILMMSVGKGAEGFILQQISGFGAETIAIRPGKEPTGPTDIAGTLFADSLKQRDFEALKKPGNVPHLKNIMPFVIIPGSIEYQGETYRPTIFGGVAEFIAETFNVFPSAGVLFNENDIKARASVVVIGKKTKEELFGDSNAVGEFVKIKGRKFRVVGVLAKAGQTSFINFDEMAVIPYTTAQTYLLGIDYYNEIAVQVDDPTNVDQTVLDIEDILRRNHNITDPSKDDFFIITEQAAVDQISSIIGALTLFLSLIVAIALVVAGVGVMNIMLVSVTERTKEVGLRKALGATDGDIMTQFLIEAVMLTGIGGLIGIALGALFSFLIAFAITNYGGLSWAFAFPVSAAVLGFIVSTLVGLVFGIYPARKASKMSPMEALRYE